MTTAELIEALATVAVPVVLALVGHWFTKAMSTKEINQKYVELAVNILNGTSTNTKLRQWAVKVINHFSVIKMDDALQRDLEDPSRGGLFPR